MRLLSLRIVAGTLLATMLCALAPAQAAVKPGDVITKDNANKVIELLSPGNYILVQEGMQLRIVPTDKLDWPPPFKAATEKYSPQVQLSSDGTLKGYVAGQPFPLLDPNDPQMATKVMWNFSYRPLYSDDIDMRFPEVASFDKHATGSPLSYYTVGHFAFYNNIGRIEVPPIPTDADGAGQRHSLSLRLLSVPGTVVVARLRDDTAAAYRSQNRRQRLGVQSADAQTAS